MKQLKRVVALVIAAVMMMSFASCSTVEEVDITNDNIKIGLILKDTKDTTTGNTGYTMNAVNEILSLGYGIGEERFNYTVESVNPDDANAVADALTQLLNKECNVIIATEEGYLDDVQKVSADNSTVDFFVCDADDDGKNIYGYRSDMSATMYFTGYVAGMKAAELEVKKVGYIAADEENGAMLDAFAKGVKAASAEATVSVVYSTDAASAADKLVKDGCVVLASDYEDEAIAKAAADGKIAFCGFGSETYLNATNEETGEKLYEDYFLCAPLYNYTQLYVNFIKVVVDKDDVDDEGNKKNLAKHGVYEGGFLEGITFLSDINENLVAEGTQEGLNVAITSYEKGELKLDECEAAGITVIK